MTWNLTLSGDTDSPEQELQILTVIRNLTEDLRSSGASSASGSFTGQFNGQHDLTVAAKPADEVPPQFGGPDVARDSESGFPLDSPEYARYKALRDSGLSPDDAAQAFNAGTTPEGA